MVFMMIGERRPEAETPGVSKAQLLAFVHFLANNCQKLINRQLIRTPE
jgi:hypothetical protein